MTTADADTIRHLTPSDLIKLTSIEDLLRDAGHTKITVDVETWRALILAAWKGVMK